MWGCAMNRIGTLLVWILFLAWLALVVQGVHAYLSLEAAGSGFTRGSNRIGAFLRWESYALVISVIAMMIGNRVSAHGMARLASRLPFWVSAGFFALLVIGFIGLILWARIFS